MNTTTHVKRTAALGFGLGVTLIALPVFAEPADAVKVFAKAKTLVAQFSDEDGPRYMYDVEFAVDGVEATGTVNMAAASGQRLVVHTPPSEQWSEEFTSEVTEFEQSSGDGLWCQELMEEVDDYSAVAENSLGMVFHARLKLDPDDKKAAKFAKNMKVQVTLSADDGAVLEYSMRATKPFRPVMVAKIKRFELDIVCERAPDGRTYAKSMRTDIEGRAMMQDFNQKETRNISNVRLP